MSCWSLPVFAAHPCLVLQPVSLVLLAAGWVLLDVCMVVCSAGLELLAEKSVTVTSAGNNSESRLIVKNNMEIIADTFTLTDTLGEEILAVDESNVRY